MSRERGSPHIEVVALLVILDVGEETDEPAHTHHEDQVEVGKRLLAAIQPQDAVLQIGKEGFVLLFTTRAVIKEFSQEQGDAELVGVEGDTGKREGNVGWKRRARQSLRREDAAAASSDGYPAPPRGGSRAGNTASSASPWASWEYG